MIASLLLVTLLSVTCYGEVNNLCQPHINEYVPNPINFGTFLQCLNGIPYETPCPEGLLYNSKAGFCYDPEDLKSALASIRDESMSRHHCSNGQCNQNQCCQNGQGCNQQCCQNGQGCNNNCCQNGQGCNNNQQCCQNSCRPPCYTGGLGYPGYPGYGFPVGTCPACNNGCEVHKLPDEKDCTVYYECSWGCLIWKRCPVGTYFDKHSQSCVNAN